MNARAAGLALGFAADRILGDPRKFHPVAGFGRVARAVEERGYADRRVRGVLFTATLVGGAAAVGVAADHVTRRHPAARAVVTAASTWAVLGGRSLAREATTIDDHLRDGDLAAARDRVTHLVGRDPSTLDADGVARATIESVAENTSDAVVAPLVWGAFAGPAGLLGYRAANTLDALVGHRTPRLERFGWASARFDDGVNLVPARLTAALAVALGDDPRGAVVAWRRDAPRHPSPNAGPVEAAFAGALGIRLGGANVYHGVVEDRGALGDGAPPTRADIARTARLATRVGVAACAVAVVVAALRECSPHRIPARGRSSLRTSRSAPFRPVPPVHA